MYDDDEEHIIHNISVNQVNLKTPKIIAEYNYKNKSCSFSSIPDTGQK